MKRFSPEYLQALRNDVDLRELIADLCIPVTISARRWTFACPLCGESDTGVHPQVNLARCFRCEKNFNAIDLVMAECGCSFLEAITYLESRLAP